MTFNANNEKCKECIADIHKRYSKNRSTLPLLYCEATRICKYDYKGEKRK